jgi:hypothetical protein
MGQYIDLTGHKFERLTALRDAGRNRWKQAVWECICECGKTLTVASGALRKGNTRSCGCLARDETINRNTTHGYTKNRSEFREYTIWLEMKNRCFDPNHKDYYKYGGRGISISSEWAVSFETFYQDMGRRPTPQHSIDRIDNSKSYSKDNCRWATKVEQSRNTRTYRTNKTGVRGVFWNERLKKYQASISVKGKNIYLGLTENFEDAVRIREKAVEEYWTESS